MRGLRSSLILLVILIGLGGYIYYENGKPPADTDAKEKAFANVKADDIEEVEIKADGDTSKLQKADGKWQVVEPVKADADTSELSSITSGLASLDIQRVVDENAGDMKK